MVSPNDRHNHRFYWTMFGMFLAGMILGRLPDLVDRPAYAQIPDSGAQRNMIVKELQGIRQDVSQMRQFLRTQTFKVRISGIDESVLKKKATTKRGRPVIGGQNPKDTKGTGPHDVADRDKQ